MSTNTPTAVVTFSPPTPSDPYATWSITHDQDVINGQEGTYKLRLTTVDPKYFFSSVTFVVKMQSQTPGSPDQTPGSPDKWHVHQCCIPGTLGLKAGTQGQFGQVSIEFKFTDWDPNSGGGFIGPDRRHMTLMVGNYQEPIGFIPGKDGSKPVPILPIKTVGVLVTVSDGISSYTSPDPQLVLQPTSGQ